MLHIGSRVKFNPETVERMGNVPKPLPQAGTFTVVAIEKILTTKHRKNCSMEDPCYCQDGLFKMVKIEGHERWLAQEWFIPS